MEKSISLTNKKSITTHESKQMPVIYDTNIIPIIGLKTRISLKVVSAVVYGFEYSTAQIYLKQNKPHWPVSTHQ